MDYKGFVELSEELKAGGNDRLKLIFEANASYCIRKLIAKFKCSSEDAEDIFIDSVLNFREKILTGKIEFLTDIRSYLYATCKNMLLERFQKAKRVNNAISELQEMDRYYYSEGLLDESRDFQEEFIKLTHEGLSALSERCRQLLKLFYFDKIGMDEIAKRLGFANTNVAKVSKSRCFQRLVDEIRVIQGSR